jgi:hypothetical protein
MTSWRYCGMVTELIYEKCMSTENIMIFWVWKYCTIKLRNIAEEMTAARERYINEFLTDILFRKLLQKKTATNRRPEKDFKKINV